MKKILLCLSLLLAFCGVGNAQVDGYKVTALNDALTSISDLKEGDLVIFRNNGRGGYLFEQTSVDGGVKKELLKFSGEVPVNDNSSASYIWKLVEVTSSSDGSLSCKFQSYTGKYIPVLNNGGTHETSLDGDLFTITKSATENATDLWNILSTSGSYFNGDAGTFTGWNGTGPNSDYQIFKPSVEKVELSTLNVTCRLENGTDPELAKYSKDIYAAVGDQVEFPKVPEYDFLGGVNEAGVEQPAGVYTHTVTEESLGDWELTYSPWPTVTFNCVDTSNNPLSILGEKEAADITKRYETNSTIALPAFNAYYLSEASKAEYEGQLVSSETTNGKSYTLVYEKATYYIIHAIDTVTKDTLKNADGVAYLTEGYCHPGSKFNLPKVPWYHTTDSAYIDSIIGVTSEDTLRINLNYATTSLPFVPGKIDESNKFTADTKWYTLRLRGTKYMTRVVENSNIELFENPLEVTDDMLWTFIGDAGNGFIIYNKAAGTRSSLYSKQIGEGSALYVAPRNDYGGVGNEMRFGIREHTDGGFLVYPMENTGFYLNDFRDLDSGRGYCKFSSWSDAGSQMFFVNAAEVEEAAAQEILKKAPHTLAAAGCVGGYTTEQLADLKAAVDAEDAKAALSAYNALKEIDPIAFEENKAYTIALYDSTEFAKAHEGVTFAVCYESADTCALWKELDASNEKFQWFFVTDSVDRYFIGNIATTKDGDNRNYYLGDYRFGETAPFVGSVEKVGYSPEAADNLVFGVFKLVRHYGAAEGEKVTLTAMGDKADVEGDMGTLNYTGLEANNNWLIREVGSYDGIGAVVAEGAEANGAIYDLSGRRVENPAKGIYIVGGKKVVVK